MELPESVFLDATGWPRFSAYTVEAALNPARMATAQFQNPCRDLDVQPEIARRPYCALLRLGARLDELRGLRGRPARAENLRRRAFQNFLEEAGPLGLALPAVAVELESALREQVDAAVDVEAAALQVRDALLALTTSTSSPAERAAAFETLSSVSSSASFCTRLVGDRIVSRWEYRSLLSIFVRMLLVDLSRGFRVERCLKCDAPYTTDTERTRYCSVHCRWAFQKQRQRAKDAADGASS